MFDKIAAPEGLVSACCCRPREKCCTLIWNYFPGLKYLPCENGRYLDWETALSFLKEQAKEAAAGEQKARPPKAEKGSQLVRPQEAAAGEWMPQSQDMSTDGDDVSTVQPQNVCAGEEDALVVQAPADAGGDGGDGVLQVHIRGGNPFSDMCGSFAALKNVVRATEGKVDYQIYAAPASVTEEAVSWLKANRDVVSLHLVTGTVDEQTIHLLAALRGKLSLTYMLSPQSLTPETIGELRWLLKREFRFDVQIDTTCTWSKDEAEVYAIFLKKLFADPAAQRLVFRRETGGACLDTTGYVWDCPRLSPLYLHSFQMDSVQLQQMREMSAAADAAEMSGTIAAADAAETSGTTAAAGAAEISGTIAAAATAETCRVSAATDTAEACGVSAAADAAETSGVSAAADTAKACGVSGTADAKRMKEFVCPGFLLAGASGAEALLQMKQAEEKFCACIL